MLRKLDLPRGLDSWCCPKGARPLGTRMQKYKIREKKCKITLSTRENCVMAKGAKAFELATIPQ